MQTQVINLNLRASDLILDRVLNPASDEMIGHASPRHLVECCGIIPDFFCQACVEVSDGELGLNLEAVCESMDEQYGFGGFEYPMTGKLDLDGTYTADNDEDEPLQPLARFGFEGRVFCYVYPYAITAVRVGLDGPYKIGRFD